VSKCLRDTAGVLMLSIAAVHVAPAVHAQTLDQSGSLQIPAAGTLPATDSQTIAVLIESNRGAGAEALMQALSPLVIADPAAAYDIVAAAGDNPEMAEALAEVLANAQSELKRLDPDKARQLATIVADAPAGFQAAYAVALSPGDINTDTASIQVADASSSTSTSSDGGAAGNASSGSDDGSGTSGVGFGGGIGGAPAGGGGGGIVSPAAP
jgi:hypothetical protein